MANTIPSNGAVIWQGAALDALPVPTGALGTEPAAISSDGSTIVGSGFFASQVPATFVRWSGPDYGQVEILPLGPGIFSAMANDASDQGVIVGYGSVSNVVEAYDLVLWVNGRGMRRLRDALAADYGLTDVLTGWQLVTEAGQDPVRISNDGYTLAGTGRNPDGELETWVLQLREVPEPSTATLACFAAACLIVESGRRSRTANCFPVQCAR